MSPRPLRDVMCPSRVVCRLGLGVALAIILGSIPSQAQLATDRYDLTGRQSLTLGSGARAMGMGGAFLARADDATAAAWNPAGLSYLRLPEVSLVGVWNKFAVERPTTGDINSQLSDSLQGANVDFAAVTWPVVIRDLRGAVQLSYQRAISFDGTRTVRESGGPVSRVLTDSGHSNGGFDVIALGTGFRLTRGLRAGLTVNRWLNGYSQNLTRTVDTRPDRPLRELDLKFRPSGWNFNVGLMWSPIEPLNVAAVYKTPFTASVELDKSRSDTFIVAGRDPEVTTNAYSSHDVRLDFPSSFGFGLSWRARETLTVSADFTQTRWSKARIRNYFDLKQTEASDAQGNPAPKTPPDFLEPLQYPSLAPVQSSADATAQNSSQQDKQEIRLGVEWVLITGAFRIPLRAGYFNDRQILPTVSGSRPRFNGFTAGVGVGFGSVLLDIAYVYEYGQYSQTVEVDSVDPSVSVQATVKNSLTANRLYASVIVRLPGRP
jgi:hypothetical protein